MISIIIAAHMYRSMTWEARTIARITITYRHAHVAATFSAIGVITSPTVVVEYILAMVGSGATDFFRDTTILHVD